MFIVRGSSFREDKAMRTVNDLARQLRHFHREHPEASWRHIAGELGVVKKDGSPDAALAWMIAKQRFHPTRQTTLDRLGIGRSPRPNWRRELDDRLLERIDPA